MATITDRLEKLPLGRFHYHLLGLISSGIAFEALDTGLIAFVLAKMIGAWNLSSAQIGFISSAGLVGMAVGAVLSGTLADRIGRKKVFTATLIIYAIGTALCGMAWDYKSLLFFRFIVGAGVGGQPPVANALMSEYAPVKHRGKMLVLQNSSWAIGWLAAALIAYFIIPEYGWQLAFYIGALPALIVVYAWRALPESAMYLVSKGRYAEAHMLVSKIEKDLGVPVGEPPAVAKKTDLKVKKFSFLDLWTPKYIRRTICLWILWFGMVYSYYGIFTWLPSLLVKNGYPLIQSFKFLLYMTLAQIPGYFAAAYFVDKIGRKMTMSTLLIACAAAAYMFGNAKSADEVLLWGCIMSFCNLGAWGITHAYSAEQYPTYARAAGVGWAAACGRFGGIVAPIAVGALMTDSSQYSTVFLMFTVALAVIAFDLIFLGKETMNRSLDELADKDTDIQQEKTITVQRS